MNSLNLLLRFILEIIAIVVFGVWGWSLFDGWPRVFTAVGLPIIFAAMWGIFAVARDPSRSGKTVVPTRGVVRLFLELVFFGLAALALFDLEMKTPAIIFVLIVVFHYVFSFKRIRWLIKN